MRINPLLIPLMAVLATPFAAGIASTSSFNASSRMPGSGNPGIRTAQATCTGCTLSTQIQKLQTVTDMGCGYYTEGEDPYLEETGICQRYACQNGYYYTFSGWTPTNICLEDPLTATPCPAGSCSQPN